MYNIESKIRKLLLITNDSSKIHEGIGSFLKIENLSYSDKRRLIVFLFNMGSYESIFDFSIKSLKKKEPLFWGVLCEILFLQNIKTSLLIQKNILKGAYKEKKLSFLALSPKATSWGKLFEKNRKRKFEILHKLYEKRQKKIQDRIRYFKDSGMPEQTMKIIEDELRSDPENKSLKEERIKIKEMIAEDIFDQFKYEYVEKSQIKRKKISKKERKISQFLREEGRRILEASPEVHNDLAFFFYFIEDHDAVISVLKKVKNRNLSSDWLHLETLILFEKYLDALEKIKEIEERYSLEKTSIFFASYYTKALCYWGLKEKERAVETLKKLIEIKPNYRSAHALLNKWETLG